MTLKELVDIFNLFRFPNVNLLKTKQNIQFSPIYMIFRKHLTSLLKPFNFLINSFTSGGFISHWMKKNKPKFKVVEENQPKSISIEQITGITILYVCLILISIVVFIAEMITKYCKFIKIIIDFLTLNSYRQ